jgi:RNA polymerase sporulation-specific sigma factor
MKLLWNFLRRLGLLPQRGIYYIGGSDVLPPPLKGQTEQDALLALEQGDENAKQTLIEHNLRLVVYIARRFENTSVGLEDLISIGTIGLIKAISTYKLDKKIKLATYASRCIENEILMHLRKTACLKAEVSLDEPINMDYDGNELLLSDILGTEEDIIFRPLEEDVDLQVWYADREAVPSWAAQAVGNMEAVSVLPTASFGSLDLEKAVTRADAAGMLSAAKTLLEGEKNGSLNRAK